MKIREIMTQQVELVHPDTSLKEAAQKMRDANVGFLPIGENDRLVGTVTDRDITIRATAEGHDPNQQSVRAVMSHDIVYCFEDQEVTEALELMSEKQLHRLVVLNQDKRLVGVVSIDDIAQKTSEGDVVGLTLADITRGQAGAG